MNEKLDWIIGMLGERTQNVQYSFDSVDNFTDEQQQIIADFLGGLFNFEPICKYEELKGNAVEPYCSACKSRACEETRCSFETYSELETIDEQADAAFSI